jgi:hypothetical protein
VHLQGSENPAGQANTDAQGQFRIDSLRPGLYMAEFHKDGFENRREARVAVSATTARLTIRLAPLSTVSGRVLTPDSRPVPGSAVLLFFNGYFEGLTATTKSDGRFSAERVRPGEYDLSARPPAGMKAPDADDGSRRAYIRTSVKLTVPPGATLSDQDITIRAVPAHSLKGRILGPTGDPAAGATIAIVPASEIPLGKLDVTIRVADDGTFEFPALFDGSWRVAADFQAGDAKLSAVRSVQMAGTDIKGLDIALRPPFSLSGKLAGAPLPRPPGIILVPEGGGDRFFPGKLESAGVLRFEGVTEGRYYIQTLTPPPLYVSSIQVGEREVLGETFDLSGPLPVTITFGADGGTVRGNVEDCGGATVVLVPQDPKLQTVGFIHRAKCQANGSFEIGGLRPGEYYAYAFENPLGPLAYSVYSNGSLAGAAVRATVRAKEVTGVTLKVTSFP